MDGNNINSYTLPASLFTGVQAGSSSVPVPDAIPDTAMARVFHGSPGTPAVDVYGNGSLIARNVMYGEMTSFARLSPGALNIRVLPAGEMSGTLINSRVTLSSNGIYTIAVTGELPNIGIRIIPEAKTMALGGNANIRVVNLSPDGPPLDVSLDDGRILQSNVRFNDITNFISAAPGTYTIRVRAAGTGRVVLTIPNVSLVSGGNYTVLITGLSGQRPGLSGVVLQNGVATNTAL